MNDVTTAAGTVVPSNDPLSIFATPATEREGVWVDIEHPTSGEIMMSWKIARFGGSNSASIIREERKLKAKLTQGQRRAIDAGAGDPDVVRRLNRQVFVRVSLLDFEMKLAALAERYPSFSYDVADTILEAYPKIYDILTEQATEENTFDADARADDAGN